MFTLKYIHHVKLKKFTFNYISILQPLMLYFKKFL
nr:MAG TPA: hypothetical protein [Caudoviricetes sp.]